MLAGVRLVREGQARVARRHPAERCQRLLARPVVARLPDHRAAQRHGQLRAHLLPASDRGANAAQAGAARAEAVQRAAHALRAGVGPLRAAHGRPGQGARLRRLHHARARRARGGRRAQAARAPADGRAARRQVPRRQRDERDHAGGAVPRDAARCF